MKKNHKTIFKWVCGILAAWLVIIVVAAAAFWLTSSLPLSFPAGRNTNRLGGTIHE